MRALKSILLLFGLAAGVFAQTPPAPDADGPPDEPGRQVARLSLLNGDAQIKRADTGEWVAAAVNTPLMAGDSLAVGNNGRAEIQFDNSHFVRVAAETELRLWELEDNRIQIQLGRGLITWRVLRQTSNQAEISTQLAAIRPLGLPSVRVEVAQDGSVRITPRGGEAEVFTQSGTERVREGNLMLINGQMESPLTHVYAAPARDGWDQFGEQRDSVITRAQSPRYVPQDVYGTEDLDAHGRWIDDPNYGYVWSPNVPASWAPYRYGRWVWQDFYGWTWVDDAPWGWAPFHYGSWYYRTGFGWSWFPGARDRRQWYRPAIVSFFGSGGFRVGVGFGNVGWVPLAPFEVYRPWYGRGWGGRGINNITVINNTNIYNSYRNSRAYNGVTAVDVGDFQRGNLRRPLNLGRNDLERAAVVRGGGPAAPTNDNLRYADRGFGGRPRGADLGNQRFYSQMGGPRNNGDRRPTFNEQQDAVRQSFDSRAGAGLGQGSRPDGNFGGFGMRGNRGDPAPNDGSVNQDRPNPDRQNQERSNQERQVWQRFGAPDQTQVPQRTGPRFGNQRTDPQPGDSPRTSGRNPAFDVAPPVVRQREAEPGFGRSRGQGNSGGFNGFGGFGAPSRPQPRVQQERQSPPPYRGGGQPRGDGGGGQPGFRPPSEGGGRPRMGGEGGNSGGGGDFRRGRGQ